MKKSALILVTCLSTLTSCVHVNVPALQSSAPDSARCWQCEIMHAAYPCTVIQLDSVCDLTTAQVREYEAANSYQNDSIEHTVTCY